MCWVTCKISFVLDMDKFILEHRVVDKNIIKLTWNLNPFEISDIIQKKFFRYLSISQK
jgi:hypothetical protein